MKRVLFLVNHDVVIYNFRRELVEELLKEGCEVIISSPYGDEIITSHPSFNSSSTSSRRKL